jgi:hypothetical protein
MSPQDRSGIYRHTPEVARMHDRAANRHAEPSNRRGMEPDETLGSEQPAQVVITRRQEDGSYTSETHHASGQREPKEHATYEDLKAHQSRVFQEVQDESQQFEDESRRVEDDAQEEGEERD